MVSCVLRLLKVLAAGMAAFQKRQIVVRTVLAASLSGLLLVFAMSMLLQGPVPRPAGVSLASLLFTSGGDAAQQVYHTILIEIRLPRVLMAILVGAVLAVSGAVLQGLLRNPLAEPALLGISGGAALGAVGSILMMGSIGMAGAGAGLLVPLSALLGGLAFASLVFRLATLNGVTSVSALLLAGVALNAMAGAGVGLGIYLAPDAQLRPVTFWALGSLSGASWEQLRLVLVPLLVALVFLTVSGARLNLFALGEREAFYLGVPVERSKRFWIVMVVVGVSSAVAVCGVIGFVGLIVPHMLRSVIGADHRFLLPMSALGGAVLLLGADGLARSWIAPAEIPVGLLTSLAGGPFFLMLLQRGLHRERL